MAVDAARVNVRALMKALACDRAYCRRDYPSNLHERCVARRHCFRRNSIAVAPSRYSRQQVTLSTVSLVVCLPTLNHFGQMLAYFVPSDRHHIVKRSGVDASVKFRTATHGKRLYLG